MAAGKAIVWFRNDLRLVDNTALHAACLKHNVLPLFILDDANEYFLGAASKWWLHYALIDLQNSLKGKLAIYKGCPLTIILQLISEHKIDAVYWNRCYEPWQIARDIKIKKSLQEININVATFNGSLLWEPFEIVKSNGSPYKVFTSFFKHGCLKANEPRKPLSIPKNFNLIKNQDSLDLNKLNLLPKIRWDATIAIKWRVSEIEACNKLNYFLQNKIFNYKEDRNFPSKNIVSELSPYLHFGQISPNQIWYSLENIEKDDNVHSFKSELVWREFSYNLLYHFPELPNKNLQQKFDKFNWQQNQKLLKAWQKGLTGYPFIDAGMRELWQTGYMHNRVRMVAASFLVKNCLINWQEGAAWFWDCLLDADLANNSASWQWVAGTGTDAAPYFRIFNPITQGQKFDPAGEYTRKFVPELAKLPDKYLFNPWDAPDEILQQAGVKLGVNYPNPIINLKNSREKALEEFAKLKLY